LVPQPELESSCSPCQPLLCPKTMERDR
jgi:hypothetical protein